MGDAHYIVQSGVREHTDVSSSVPYVAQLAAVLPVTMFEFHCPDIALPGLTLREGTVVALPSPTARSRRCRACTSSNTSASGT